ncbi:MAG: dienelactone hydrolase family protein [Acidisphaera sp.]|nr:dienelactone hydrolase family protein [Acidisphaera sp.]
MRAAIALLFPLLLAGRALVGAHIVDPWPDPETLPPPHVEEVSFPSSSPFDPAALGTAEAPPATAIGTLYEPAGTRPDHGTPAVVMLHGAAGLVAERGATYGPQLAAMGVAVLVIDTFGARREMGTGFNERVLNVTETMFVADAYAGLRYLAGLPEIDAHRVVLAGFSYGGMATMYALYAQMADRASRNWTSMAGLRFAGHVAFYGPCIARFRDSRTTGAPLLMLYGEQDELIRPQRCEQIAQDLRAGGSDVKMIAYPGAVHQWDGGMARRLIGRNLSACDFTVGPDGTIHDTTTGIAMTGSFMRKVLLAFCVSSQPYPIGRDAKVRAESNRDFGRFLTRVFATP